MDKREELNDVDGRWSDAARASFMYPHSPASDNRCLSHADIIALESQAIAETKTEAQA